MTTKQCAFCGRGIPEQDYLREAASNIACHFELAAALVAACATTAEAAAALENEALKIRRRWSKYPIPAPGEREYLSWETRPID